ncbi:MAG: hypothetical protein ACQKBV_08225 [Puniceicoccales bacterium]
MKEVKARHMRGIMDLVTFEKKVHQLALWKTHRPETIKQASRVFVDGASCTEVAKEAQITVPTLSEKLRRIHSEFFADTYRVVLAVPAEELDQALKINEQWLVICDAFPGP